MTPNCFKNKMLKSVALWENVLSLNLFPIFRTISIEMVQEMLQNSIQKSEKSVTLWGSCTIYVIYVCEIIQYNLDIHLDYKYEPYYIYI